MAGFFQHAPYYHAEEHKNWNLFKILPKRNYDNNLSTLKTTYSMLYKPNLHLKHFNLFIIIFPSL